MTVEKEIQAGARTAKGRTRRPPDPDHHTEAALAPPTAREIQLILLIAQGLPNKIIAYKLGISPNTVRCHVSNIMRKYNLRNRTQVAILFMPKLGQVLSTASHLV